MAKFKSQYDINRIFDQSKTLYRKYTQLSTKMAPKPNIEILNEKYRSAHIENRVIVTHHIEILLYKY